MGRTEEHGCELVVERIEHGLWRVAVTTTAEDAIRAAGAIRLSAANLDRVHARQAL
jgi:hypothetical protein